MNECCYIDQFYQPVASRLSRCVRAYNTCGQTLGLNLKKFESKLLQKLTILLHKSHFSLLFAELSHYNF